MENQHKKSREDFSEWSGQKAVSHFEKQRPAFKEREVWFCSLGANIGFEQDGKGKNFLRPVVIVKKFNNEICWGIPTTKQNKEGRHYFSFSYKEGAYTTGIISQMRLIDSKRLSHKIGALREGDFAELKKRIISFLK